MCCRYGVAAEAIPGFAVSRLRVSQVTPTPPGEGRVWVHPPPLTLHPHGWTPRTTRKIAAFGLVRADRGPRRESSLLFVPGLPRVSWYDSWRDVILADTRCWTFFYHVSAVVYSSSTVPVLAGAHIRGLP